MRRATLVLTIAVTMSLSGCNLGPDSPESIPLESWGDSEIIVTMCGTAVRTAKPETSWNMSFWDGRSNGDGIPKGSVRQFSYQARYNKDNHVPTYAIDMRCPSRSSDRGFVRDYERPLGPDVRNGLGVSYSVVFENPQQRHLRIQLTEQDPSGFSVLCTEEKYDGRTRECLAELQVPPIYLRATFRPDWNVLETSPSQLLEIRSTIGQILGYEPSAMAQAGEAP